MVSKQAVDQLARILVEELGHAKAQKLVNRVAEVKHPTGGNQSFQQTLAALIAKLKTLETK